MRFGQGHDLEAHILDVAETAVHYQHRWSGAKRFTKNANVIDTDMLTAVGLARKSLPEIELPPSACWLIHCTKYCAHYRCQPRESGQSNGRFSFHCNNLYHRI